eukprot:EG_transcript_2912
MRWLAVACTAGPACLVLLLLLQTLLPHTEGPEAGHPARAPHRRHHSRGAEAAAAAAVTDGDKKGHRPRPTEVVVPPYATAQDAVPPKSGRPEAATAPHKALEDPPAVIDTADMHTLQAAPGSREAGAKVLSHCPRCPPGFLAAWCDERLPLAQRVAALVANLTVEEKARFLTFTFLELPRIHWHRYNWWNEALHGVAREVGVTSFPQVISLAASFNRTLWHTMATAISDEARGRAADPSLHTFGRKWMFRPKLFLTFWSPNVNIFRDPRWGRGHETPGEDPFLTAEYAHQFVTGMQGDHPVYLKTSACCKHFAAYSLEKGRFGFNAVIPDPRDLRDTYFPAFHSCVTRSKVSGVMCSYNAINGVPACANRWLLTDTLRSGWGFEGYTVSDCDGLAYVWRRHKFTSSAVDTVAKSLDAGLELDCGSMYSAKNIGQALQEGAVSEQQVNKVVTRLFTILFQLGYFNTLQSLPFWASHNASAVDTPLHRTLAKEAALQGIVLLKNVQRTLPLPRASIHRLAVLGPSANVTRAMQGNYYGGAPYLVPPLQGLRAWVADIRYVRGCSAVEEDANDFETAAAAAAEADATVLFLGISGTQERENHDRSDIGLPAVQHRLLRAVSRRAKGPLVVVLISGSSVDLSTAAEDPAVGAILWAGYPGQAGGAAIADVLFGAYNPGGRLPVTFHFANYTDAVDFHEMGMRSNASSGHPGRTYRFFEGPVLFPFGHGLSYSTLRYRLECPAAVSLAAAQRSLLATVHAPHTARRLALLRGHVGLVAGPPGSVALLLFLHPPPGRWAGNPQRSLAGFERVAVPGPATVAFPVTAHQLAVAAPATGRLEVLPGTWVATLEDQSCQFRVE